MPAYPATDGALLAYRDRGRGDPAIVFVHGWQADGSVWHAVIDRLAAQHRTLAVDLRGAGASAAAPGPYTVEQFSDDLAALIASLRTAPVVVVGHSMGGTIAQRLAVDHPALVAGLVLVAPVPASGLPLSERARAIFAAVPDDDAALHAWLGMLTAQPLGPERFAMLVRAASAIAPAAAHEAFESWSRAAFEADARTIGVPALVIAGAADRPQTPQFLRDTVVAVIPQCRITVVADAGHYVHVEDDERVAAIIDAFVRELADPSSV